jgi:hypothetical protein
MTADEYLKLREPFLQNPLSVQLEKLEANLWRVALRDEPREVVFETIRESQHFVDWIVRSLQFDAHEELIAFLRVVMRQISEWKAHWDKTWETPELMRVQTRAWAEEVSNYAAEIREVETLWVQETERRFEQMEAGQMRVILGEEVRKMTGGS